MLGWVWALGKRTGCRSSHGVRRSHRNPRRRAARNGTEPKEKEDAEKNKRRKHRRIRINRIRSRHQVQHHGVKGLGKDFLEDQKQIWTSPARLRFVGRGLARARGGFAAGLFVTDRDLSTHLSNNPNTISDDKTLSDAGLAALIGGAGAMWLLSYPAHSEHWRETGFLAGEAAINSSGCGGSGEVYAAERAALSG